jgi:hypothetical protein
MSASRVGTWADDPPDLPRWTAHEPGGLSPNPQEDLRGARQNSVCLVKVTRGPRRPRRRQLPSSAHALREKQQNGVLEGGLKDLKGPGVHMDYEAGLPREGRPLRLTYT